MARSKGAPDATKAKTKTKSERPRLSRASWSDTDRLVERYGAKPEGGRVLIVLPLVGSKELVRACAKDWLVRLSETMPTRLRKAALERFLTLLLDRLGRASAREALKGQDRLLKGTAMGRALIAEGGDVEGLRASIVIVVEQLLGAVPTWLPARLEAVTRRAQLEKLLRGVACVESVAELEALLPPAGRGRRRAR